MILFVILELLFNTFHLLGLKLQNILGNNRVKERILQRIQPWMRRELQAILRDTEPSVIVHVAASLYISSLEVKAHAASGRHCTEDNSLAPLQPFLLDRTNMFWHELRYIMHVKFIAFKSFLSLCVFI